MGLAKGDRAGSVLYCSVHRAKTSLRDGSCPEITLVINLGTLTASLGDKDVLY